MSCDDHRREGDEMIETSEIEITFSEDDRHTEARVRGPSVVRPSWVPVGQDGTRLTRTCRWSVRNSLLLARCPTWRTNCLTP